MGIERAHVLIGDQPFTLDESNPDYNLPYRRWSRSIFADQPIVGSDGQNLRPEQLVWNMTEFDGEGQVVLDASDDFSKRLFYRSEGIDFRIPGQMQLNQSSLIVQPTSSGGSTATTLQGAANFADVTGVSTTAATDRKLTAVNDVVGSDVITPGAGQVQADYYLYADTEQYSTIEGSAFAVFTGTGQVIGSDISLVSAGTIVTTVDQSTLTAGVPYTVEFYAYLSAAYSGATKPTIRCSVIDTTVRNDAFMVDMVDNVKLTGIASPADGSFQAKCHFTPRSGHLYQFWVTLMVTPGSWNGYVLCDRVRYSKVISASETVTISVYNSSGSTTIASQTLNISNTASALSGTLLFTSAAATNYSFRVSYGAGAQSPWVDKLVYTIRSTSSTVYHPEIVDVGSGGYVWAVGYSAAGSPITWTYDFSTKAWTVRTTLSTHAAGTRPLAMCHSDAYQYILGDDDEVSQTDTSNAAEYVSAAATTGTCRGICIAQDRLIVLTEDTTNGVWIYTFPVDGAGATYGSATSSVQVTTAKVSPTTTLRQRMVGTPTGARFYVNYGSAVCRVYEADTSTSTPTVRMLAELPDGVQGTSIEHTGGKTFVGGQFLAGSGQLPRSALWMIDESGAVIRAALFRRDDPEAAPPVWIDAYQNDLNILMGSQVWRYSLITSGLYLEYKLQPGTITNARSLAATQGVTLCTYAGEGMWVTGSQGTYRTGGTTSSNEYISSIFDNGLPFETKMLTEIVLLTDPIPTGTSVAVQYDADQTGTWTHLGNCTRGQATHHLRVSLPDNAVTYGTIQVRVVLGTNGSATPVIYGITVRGLTTSTEDYIDLNLLLADEDSSSRVHGKQRTGGEMAQYLRSLKTAGTPVGLTDYYGADSGRKGAGAAISNLVRIESVDQIFVKQGEGRGFVRMRILS